MKILVDARLYGLENAGLGRYLSNLISELSKIDSGDEYIILLRKKYFDELNLPKNWHKVLVDIRHYSLAEQVKLPSIISAYKPDVVHFPHFNVPFFFKGNFVVTVHDMLMHKFNGLSATTLPWPIYFLKQIIYKNVFKKGVTSSRNIIVPSNTVKKELVDYYNLDDRKVKVILEGYDEKIQSNYNPAPVLKKYGITTKYFIYTGNAYPHKNLNRLIEAVVSLNRETDNKTVLVIASSRNIFTERLQKVIDNLKANKFVKLIGFVTDFDLGVLYKASVGFVFPSLSEGFGLPGLEAMSCSTLLLCSDIPVFKEIYGDNAIYFNPLDFSSIQNSMKIALEMDLSKRNIRIIQAQKFVKKYSWTKMAEETLEIYKNSINK